MTEKAVFFSRIEDLTAYPQSKLHDFSHLYFGNEFCEGLIPDVKDVELALDFCAESEMKFVLVTPYTTDRGIIRISSLIRHLLEKGIDFEVVFNDWGVLYLCFEMGVRHAVMGRLLNKLKRDPRIVMYKDEFSTGMYEYLQTPGAFSSSFMSVLKRYNVERMEFDNTLQGICMNRSDAAMKYSIYYPYLYFTTSRTCENNFAYTNGVCDNSICCGAGCREKAKRLRMGGVKEELFFIGRTFFLRNDSLDERFEEHFDRLILQEVIPH